MYKFKSEVFKEIYKNRGFTQGDIAESIGVSIDTVKSWTRTNSKNGPDETNIKSIAKLLKVRIEEIAEIDKAFVSNKISPMLRPLIGLASCGVPTTYYYDDVEMIEAPQGSGERSYYVRADGDSMIPRINTGDLILCDPDLEIFSGNIVHFEWDGEHGIKRYVEQNGIRMMVAINQEYAPIIITDEFELRMTRCVQVTTKL